MPPPRRDRLGPQAPNRSVATYQPNAIAKLLPWAAFGFTNDGHALARLQPVWRLPLRIPDYPERQWRSGGRIGDDAEATVRSRRGRPRIARIKLIIELPLAAGTASDKYVPARAPIRGSRRFAWPAAETVGLASPAGGQRSLLRAVLWLPIAPGSGAVRRRATARGGTRRRRTGALAGGCRDPSLGTPTGSRRASGRRG